MKASVIVTRGEFCHNWILQVEFGYKKKTIKQFFLGQDVKFCTRVLGISPHELVRVIRGNQIEDPKVNKRLARYILGHIRLTTDELKKLESWELCSQ